MNLESVREALADCGHADHHADTQALADLDAFTADVRELVKVFRATQFRTCPALVKVEEWLK